VTVISSGGIVYLPSSYKYDVQRRCRAMMTIDGNVF
jgi:hypothetical protein